MAIRLRKRGRKRPFKQAEPGRGRQPIQRALAGALLLGAISAAAAPTLALHLHTRLEKTIFRVDVLDLDLFIEGKTAAAVRSQLVHWPWSDALADALADTLAHARHARARIDFLRDLSLDRFLGGIDDSMHHAVEAGWLSRVDEEHIAQELPAAYAFLRSGGIHRGDRMFYRVNGDSLRIRYLTRDGEERLNQVDVGPQRRLGLLGSYFAPGSDFREGLLESLRRVSP